MKTKEEQEELEQERSAEEEDRTFFKKSLGFFGGSIGFGALVVCCAVVAPLFVSAVAGAVLGFISGVGGVALAIGAGGVLAARAMRRRRAAACDVEGRPVIGREARRESGKYA